MRRAYRCLCGQRLFFRNTQCIACKRSLGYQPEAESLAALEPAGEPDLFRLAADGMAGRFVRCANLQTPAACNWLVPVADDEGARTPAGRRRYCVACRLNRTVPDWSIERNAENWRRIELAKRRLVSSLLSLKLPVLSWFEDRERGLAFDFLDPSASSKPVLIGHARGVVTLNVDEADDATREALRARFHEPYRTVLGHLRHEVGHYYWERLVADSAWLEPFRARFGDERQEYAAALRRHYEQGPLPGWQKCHISGYASVHPWEDWAESWAHYMHMVDALDTASSYGLNLAGAHLESGEHEFVAFAGDASAAPLDEFARLFDSWLKLTQVLNELSSSMGEKDFYPFVVGAIARSKLQFVHEVISRHRDSTRSP